MLCGCFNIWKSGRGDGYRPIVTMNGANEQTHSKAQCFFYSLFLGYIYPHCLECSKAPFLPQNCGFLRRKPMVSSLVQLGNRWFLRRKPVVSTVETSGFYGGNRWILLGRLSETIVIVEIIYILPAMEYRCFGVCLCTPCHYHKSPTLASLNSCYA